MMESEFVGLGSVSSRLIARADTANKTAVGGRLPSLTGLGA
jgi:hypothetical protein